MLLINNNMDYKLAKQLKECSECKSVLPSDSYNSRKYCNDGCRNIARRKKNVKWQRTYYLKNKESINKKTVIRQRMKYRTDKIYREDDLTKGHNRRALIEGNGGKHTTDEWLSLIDEYKNKCAWCKEEKPLTRDHIVPLSRGGTNKIENIQPLCSSCNSSKRNYDKPKIKIGIDQCRV